MNKKQKVNSKNFSHLSSGVLVLENKTIFKGIGIGYQGTATGEVCFNTSLTGYQEIISDPSYAGQIINFTFPHIGNVGTNKEDMFRGVTKTRCYLNKRYGKSNGGVKKKLFRYFRFF